MLKVRRSLSAFLTLTLIFVMIFGFSFPVSATTATDVQTLGGHTGDPLQIKVYDNGRIGLLFWQHSDPSNVNSPYGYVRQYFNEYSWGSNIFFTDSATANYFSTDYSIAWGPYTGPGGITVADIGLGTSVVNGNSVTTTWTFYNGELQLVQTITYLPGNHYYEKKFALTNLSDRTFTGVAFNHGGDTYFGGDDAATSYWSDSNKMIYIKNNNTTMFGMMGFYGSTATPADHYFGGSYSTGNTAAAANALPDTADSNFTDAGYQLGWDKGDLAADETWAITAYEQITEPGSIQVMSPAEQEAARGSQVTYDFLLQNFLEDPATFNLTAISEHGWNVAITEGASVNVDGVGAAAHVHVVVDVPADAELGATDIITLTAAKSDDATVNAVGASRTIVDEDFPTFMSIVPSATELLPTDTSLDVDIETNNVADGSEVIVTLLDADKNPLDPSIFGSALISAAVPDSAIQYFPGFDGIDLFVSKADPAKGRPAESAPARSDLQTILPGSATVHLTLPGNLAAGTYYLDVAIASAELDDNTTAIEVLEITPTTIDDDLPATGEQTPWQPMAYGAALIVLAGGALLIRRRINHSENKK